MRGFACGREFDPTSALVSVDDVKIGGFANDGKIVVRVVFGEVS